MRINIKKMLGIFTAAALLITSIPFTNIIFAKSGGFDSYVVWEANPDNISGGDMVSARPTQANGQDKKASPYIPYKRTNEAVPYYQVELKGSGDNHGALIANKINSTTAAFKWLNDKDIANALAPYLSVKYDMRTTGTKYNAVINISAASVNTKNNAISLFSSKAIDKQNTWVENIVNVPIGSFSSTNKWTAGWLRVCADSSETFSTDDTVTVDLRKIRLEVKESDRLNINEALKNISAAQTLFSTTDKDSNGNNDYFSVLIGFDKESEYSSNYYPDYYLVETDVVSGKGEIQVDGLNTDNKILEDETVEFTVVPDYGYITENVTVKDSDEEDIAVKQDTQNPNKYTFTMPKKAVKIYAMFKDDGTGVTNSYIIWDANPDKTDADDEESVKPESMTTLKSEYDTVKRTDEEISYYHAEFKSGGDGQNAVFQSGLGASQSGMGWMSSSAVLQAIDEYMIVKYEYRTSGPFATTADIYVSAIENGNASSGSGFSSRFGAARAGSENTWLKYNDDGIKGITFGKTWKQGWITFNTYAYPTNVSAQNYVNVDLRKVRIELEGSDRLKINEKLAEVDGIDNIQGFTKGVNIDVDAAGNKDYFSLLIAYDEQSAYTENVYPVKHNITTIVRSGKGSINLLGAKLSNKGPEGKTITVIPEASMGYTFKSVKAVNADGSSLELQKISDNKYTFVMPANAVKIYAEFEDDGSGIRDSYVIWDINPEDLSIDDGESASPKNLNTNKSAYNFIKKEDEAIPYFTTTLTGQGDGSNSILAGKLSHQVEGFGWMDNLELLEALSDYMQVKYDIRTGGPAYNTALYIKATRNYLGVGNVLSDWGSNYVADEPDIWISREIKPTTFQYNWYSGFFHINGWGSKPISSSNYMTVDIRNLRMELKEEDRFAVNEALSGVKNIDDIPNFTKDTEIGKDSKGNKDYFSLLIKYDSESGLSPNTILDKVSVKGKISEGDGKIEFVGLDENGKANIDAEVTVKLTPSEKYVTTGIIVEDSNGNTVDTVKINDNEYKFNVPSGHTTVSAVFERDPLQNEYVIFEANPDTVKTSELDCSVEKDGSVTKGYDLEGNNYYILKMQGDGEKASVNILSGRNSQTAGYGYLDEADTLTALSRFAKISFNYKSDNALPNDAKLEIYAGNTLLASTTIAKSEDWKNYSEKMPNDTVFTENWNNGNLAVKLVSASGGISGEFSVYLSEFKIEVAETQREQISEALAQSGSGLVFANIIESDKYSAYSTTEYEKTGKIFVLNPDFADVSISSARGAYGETITLSVIERTGHFLNTVKAVDSKGNEVLLTPETGGDYTFNIPLNTDVFITVDTYSQEELDSMRLVWYSNASSTQALPYFIGVSERPYSYTMIDADEGQSGYEFTINKTEGALNVYGTYGNLPLKLFTKNAEISFRAKVESDDGVPRVIKVGTNLGDKTKEIVVDNEWKQFSVAATDIIGTGDALEFVTFSLDGMQINDKLCIGEIYLWSQTFADISDYDKFKIAYDVTSYEKFETNTLLGELGDTTAIVQPWNETRSGNAGPDYVVWDNGWYEKFQNKNSWNIAPTKEDYDPTYKYILTFYGESVDVSKYESTGYLEFYIKSALDGLNVPLVLSFSTDEGNKLINFPVRYEKSNAREDGWMQVRVPYTFFSGMGVNLSGIGLVKISSNIEIDASFQLSSFRFYDRYADNPDPDPIVEEVIEERDIPLDMDSSLLNVYLDKENLKLYVPYNTYLWELLAAAELDTTESTLAFMDSLTGMGVFDTESVIGDNIEMTVYRRGYTVVTFQVIVATEEQGKSLGITELKKNK